MWSCRACNYDRCEECFRSAQAPGSPRLAAGGTSNPLHAVTGKDNPLEIIQFFQANPGEQEVKQREQWTKGVKWNVACCLARGAVIAHFEDGCLYSPYYLGFMRGELLREDAQKNGSPELAAATLSRWCTVDIANLRFRSVDLTETEPGEDAAPDLYANSFVYVYTRSAWELQPFPDRELVGHEDLGFMKRLKRQGVPIKLVAEDELVACGWHRLATCGSGDPAANINYSQVLNAFASRGEPLPFAPQAFEGLLSFVREVAYELLLRRELHVKSIIDERGPLYVCAMCNVGVALQTSLKGSSKGMTRKWAVGIGTSCSNLVFDVGEFSSAGGAVAEGQAVNWADDNQWLCGWITRAAICRNCGFHLGWRHEKATEHMQMCKSPSCGYREYGPTPVKDVFSREPGKIATFGKKEFPGFCCVSCAESGGRTHDKKCMKALPPEPTGPIFWTLAWRQLRERRGPAERPPLEKALRPHRSRQADGGRAEDGECPAGHQLWSYGVQQPFYSCDECGGLVDAGRQLWGCSACEYDVCERCRRR